MKSHLRYVLVCLFTLSSAFCRVESKKVPQNFNDMFYAVPQTLEVKNSNETGTTDFVTYTCSGGADFNLDTYKTNGEIAIFLETSDAQVVTTQIQNLDSISITFTPTWSDKDHEMFYVAISDDGISWKNLSTKYFNNTTRTVKFPQAGSYYVRIKRKSTNVYLRKIDYIYLDLSDCPNCFIYKP